MPTIAEEDITKRKKSNTSVQGSISLEGLTIDPISAEIGRRFDEGEITIEEFSILMQQHASQLARTLRARPRPLEDVA